LREPVVVREAFGIDDQSAQSAQALFETLGLGYPAQGSDFATLDQVQTATLAGKNVLEIKRVMNALDDAGAGIVSRDATAQFLCLAVAFGYENGAGACEM